MAAGGRDTTQQGGDERCSRVAQPGLRDGSSGGPPRDVRSILVRGVNWLGDAVMTTPALQRLREAFPSGRISLLTPAKLADLWLSHPAVDAVLATSKTESLWRTAARLRREHFDLGIVLPNSLRSAAELWLGRVPARVGYAANGRSWLLTRAIERPADFVPMRKRSESEVRRLAAADRGLLVPVGAPPASAHHLHHYLRLVAAVGASSLACPPALRVTEEEVAAVCGRFNLASDVKWLGINAGAEYGPAKRWPAGRFAAVARAVASWPGWGVVLFGGEADAGSTREMEAEVRSVASNLPNAPRLANLAGQTSLRELCASLSACRVLVTNDTGPMHLAAALGVPVRARRAFSAPARLIFAA